jgi:hypothetical protein
VAIELKTFKAFWPAKWSFDLYRLLSLIVVIIGVVVVVVVAVFVSVAGTAE